MRALRRHLHAYLGGLSGVFWTLWWGLLVNRFASFVSPFLAVYLVRARGMGVAEAGRVVALYGVGVVLGAPIGGALADRVGRRATMVGGLAAGALTVGALALARGAPWLAALALAAGATNELFRPAMNAALADVVPPADRARAFGLVYWAVNIAIALGMLLAGAVAERSVAALLLVDAATSLAFAGIVLARVPETRPAGLVHEPALRGTLAAFRDGPFVTFLALHFVALVAFGQWQLGLPLDMAAHGLGPSRYALLMAMNCALVVLLQPALGPRLRGRDSARLLALMSVLIGVGYGLNAFGGGLAVYVIGTALWTLGEVVGFPAASALVADLAPAALRGRYQGAWAMMVGLTMTFAPLFGGEVYGRLGPRVLWWSCLAMGLAAAAGQLAAGGARRRRLAELCAAEQGAPGPAATGTGA